MQLLSPHHVRLPVERLAGPDEVFPSLRVVELDESVVERGLDLLEEFLRLEVEREVAVDAEVFLRGRLLGAPRTGHRGSLTGSIVVDADVEAVHRGVLLLLSLPGELRDVPGDDGRSASPSLAVLDECLGLPADGSEPVRVTLPEVGWCDGLLDAGAFGGLLEALQESRVAQLRRLGQARPHVIVAIAGVLGEPLLDVRDGRDEVDVVLATLPVDADLQRVFAISDVANAHVVEFATAKATLELEGDDRAITRVPPHFDHRLDVVLEVEHVGLVRLGVVVPSGLRRDPVVSLGDLVVSGDVSSEEAEGDAVVAIRLLGAIFDVVRVVDPADDGLRGVLCVVELLVGRFVSPFEDGVDEVDPGVLAHPDEVPEEFFVSVVAVVLTSESELVAELQEEIAIPVTSPTLARLELPSERLNAPFRIRCHDFLSNPTVLRVWLKALHRLLPNPLQSHGDRARSHACRGDSVASDTVEYEPHAAIATPEGGVAA